MKFVTNWRFWSIKHHGSSGLETSGGCSGTLRADGISVLKLNQNTDQLSPASSLTVDFLLQLWWVHAADVWKCWEQMFWQVWTESPGITAASQTQHMETMREIWTLIYCHRLSITLVTLCRRRNHPDSVTPRNPLTSAGMNSFYFIVSVTKINVQNIQNVHIWCWNHFMEL